MGSGTSGVSREKGGGLKPGDVIGTTDMISARANFEENSVNSVLNVGRDMVDEYGEEIVAFEVADLKPNAQGVLGYYDGSNIAINSSFMNTARINDAYDTCVKSGYHPSRGNKTAMEAVAAHEYGHALTDAAARKMGASDLNTAATQIVNEARKSTSHRGGVSRWHPRSADMLRQAMPKPWLRLYLMYIAMAEKLRLKVKPLLMLLINMLNHKGGKSYGKKD